MTLDPTLRSFVFYAENLRGLPKGLATAVIRQHGGWRSFKKDAIDFANHGVVLSKLTLFLNRFPFF